AAEAGLPVRAVRGVSPQDVGALAAGLGGPVDLALIDGLHTNAQILLDWRAVKSVAAPDALYLFHDVHAFDLYEGLAHIEAESELVIRRMMATLSGMAVGHMPALADALAPVFAAFSPAPESLRVIEAEAWRRAHRTRARLTRSLLKRRNKLRRWLGKPALP